MVEGNIFLPQQNQQYSMFDLSAHYIYIFDISFMPLAFLNCYHLIEKELCSFKHALVSLCVFIGIIWFLYIFISFSFLLLQEFWKTFIGMKKRTGCFYYLYFIMEVGDNS